MKDSQRGHQGFLVKAHNIQSYECDGNDIIKVNQISNKLFII